MPMSESEAALLLLGGDPWMRFDMWAARSWDMATKATEIAVGNGPSMSSDDTIDGRTMAMFHAAQLAKEFAEMLNPLIVAAGMETEEDEETTGIIMTPEMIAEILSDDDE